MDRNPSVFVSYSWDSTEHKNWVLSLVGKLYGSGVEASIDVLETQKETVNLYNMMIKNIREKDYTIIVLTEKYADRADGLTGGVGFETNMLIPSIIDNLGKIIPIVRTNGDKSKLIPFYLRGASYIDFSNDDNFEDSFKELLHKIYKVDMIEMPKLGKRPDLKSMSIESITKPTSRKVESAFIPQLSKVTDMDKNRFMKDSYAKIIGMLHELLQETKVQNKSFDFDFDEITSKKTIAKMYLDGMQKYGFKIWVDGGLGEKVESIKLQYGNHISSSDNSMNEIIMCEIDEDNRLVLRMTMSYMSDKKTGDFEKVALDIWKNAINYIR